MDWFRVPNPLQTPIFVGVMTWEENEPGRMDMLNEILSKLRDVYVRKKLILLHGDGGFGKTALAYEAARRLAPNFRGGVLWFDGRGRAEISLDSFLDGTFGTVLGEEFTKGDPEIKRKMAVEFLRARSEAHEPVLIVADNLDFASKPVWNFLTYLPERCSAIATSRIVPKDVPTIEKFRVNELVGEEAEWLLYLHANVHIDGESAKEIVRLTGGVPAAIEFAAADINDPEIGLERTLKNLKRWPSRNVASRFDFTYEPLDEEMKRFLWLISLFPSGIEPEIHLKLMCEKLSDDDQPPFGERWEKLWDELVRRRQWVRLSFIEGRYEMHPVVRDYIQHRAKDTDPETFDSFERRFIRVMSKIADDLHSRLQSDNAAMAVHEAEIEHDNLLEAQRIARDKGMWQEVLDLAYDLNGLFTCSGHWSDRLEVLENGLEAARKLDKRWDKGAMLGNLGNLAYVQGRYDEAKGYLKCALEIFDELGQKAEMATALNNLGNLAFVQGRYDEAKEYYKEALEISEELGDRAGVAMTLNNLGTLAYIKDRYDEAKGYLEKALEISEELGDRAGVAQTLHNLGNLALRHSRYDEAKEYFEEALEVFNELGQKAEMATTLNNLGNLAYVHGRYDEAKGYFEEASSIRKELVDRAGVVQTPLDLGIPIYQQGPYGEALVLQPSILSSILCCYNVSPSLYKLYKEYFEEVLEVFDELGQKAEMATTLNNLGNLALRHGRYDEAKEYFEEALEVFDELGQKAEMATTLNNLGSLAFNQGRYNKAKEYYERALDISEELRDWDGVAQTLLGLGNLAYVQGRYDEAKKYYEKSLDISKELGNRAGMAQTFLGLGNIAMNQCQYDEAKEYFEQSLSISKELGDWAGVAQTLINLGILANNLNKPKLAFKFTAIALFMLVSMKHADNQKAGQNIAFYVQKLGYDEGRLKAELNKIVKEIKQRGYELVDELLRELEDAVG